MFSSCKNSNVEKNLLVLLLSQVIPCQFSIFPPKPSILPIKSAYIRSPPRSPWGGGQIPRSPPRQRERPPRQGLQQMIEQTIGNGIRCFQGFPGIGYSSVGSSI
jgi:hypothetical protein